eukprot:4537153-Prorocentrum_lima.AAC.1
MLPVSCNSVATPSSESSAHAATKPLSWRVVEGGPPRREQPNEASEDEFEPFTSSFSYAAE